MLFQSLGFLIFFTIFFFIYWSVSGNKAFRNGLVFAAGIFLYSLWDVRFTVILFLMIFINFMSGEFVSEESKARRPVFYLVLVLNLLPLAFFKYFNFFISEMNGLLSFFGLNTNISYIESYTSYWNKFLYIFIS
jgi:alginate O-acetyltransferase complex protein AlgI